MYDAVIIGSGPAGLSAAINLKLHEKDFIWFGSRDYSDKVEKSEKIANYPGLGLIPGAELNARFDAHAKEMGLEPVDKKVTNVMPADGYLMVLAENEVYETKTLLLATGVLTAKSYEGEDELLGRGVSYCATCDGFLYKGKTIAVFCGAPRYEHEVEYLAGIGLLGIMQLRWIFTMGVYVIDPGTAKSGKTYWVSVMLGLAVLVNLGANAVLTPRLGLYGAVISELLGYVTAMCGRWIVSDRLFPGRMDIVRLKRLHKVVCADYARIRNGLGRIVLRLAQACAAVAVGGIV